MIHAMGSNACGQLGTGCLDDVSVPTAVVAPRCRMIACGANHSLLLTIEGLVYGAGSNQDGQLGLGESVMRSSTFGHVPIPSDPTTEEKCVQVAAGWTHSLVLDAEGNCWAFGNNSHGQLGLPTDTFKSVVHPQRIPGLPKLVSVKVGLHFSLALDQEGRVWGWGWNKHGELGPNEALEKKRKGVKTLQGPRMLSGPSHRIVQIACGQHHALMLTDQGQVLSMGWNKFGQLGRVSAGINDAFLEPIAQLNLSPMETVTSTFSGWTFSGVLTSTGRCFLWGRCDKGQLGLSPEEIQSITPESFKAAPIPCVWKPFLSSQLPPLSEICCGSEHALAIGRDSKTLWTWGWNEHGNCGVGHCEDLHGPSQVSLSSSAALCVAAGYGSSFVLS